MLSSRTARPHSLAYGRRSACSTSWKTHQPESDRPVPEVGMPSFGYRVEVDVDHVVEHPHGGPRSAFQACGVETL